MKILKGVQLLVLLPALFFCLGAAEQTRSEESQLKFTVSDESRGWDPLWAEAMQIAKPTHVAIFQLENPRIGGSKWFTTTTKVKGIVKRGEEGKVGAVLRRVLFTGEESLREPYEFLLSEDRVGDNRVQFWLYGASEQQAREMAEALIEVFKGLADVYVRRAEAELELLSKRVADANDEIPKIEERKRAAEAEFREFKKTTYYRNADEAEKSILEWNNLLSAVEVDIIGIQAKLDMINRLKEYPIEERAFGDWEHSLLKMKMTEEIELAGVLARKNAAESHRKKALKFLDLSEKRDDLRVDLAGKGRQLSDDKAAIASIEGRLPQLRAEVRPVQVVDNEVEIHPVE